MYYGMGLFHLGTRLVTVGFCEGLFHSVTDFLFLEPTIQISDAYLNHQFIKTNIDMKKEKRKSGPIDGLPIPPKKKVVIFPEYDTETSYKMRNMLFIEYYGVR